MGDGGRQPTNRRQLLGPFDLGFHGADSRNVLKIEDQPMYRPLIITQRSVGDAQDDLFPIRTLEQSLSPVEPLITCFSLHHDAIEIDKTQYLLSQPALPPPWRELENAAGCLIRRDHSPAQIGDEQPTVNTIHNIPME